MLFSSRRRTRLTATPARRWVRVGTGLAVAAALTAAACTSGGEKNPAPTSPASPTTAAPSPTESEATMPDTPAGSQAAWVLGALNGSAAVSEDDVRNHLAETMFEEVSATEFTQVFEQLRGQQPWRLAKADGDETRIVARITGGSDLDVTVSVDADENINGLFFAPASADRTPATGWDDISNAVRDLPASTQINVTKVTGDPEAVLEIGDDVPKPIGSTFKLYVLSAVVAAVDAGDLGWDDSLTVTEDVKSLPSGKLQDEPDGTEVSVREAAELMISISDNTATDMLIDAVGRDAVENAQETLGHHDPGLNTPFLTTRELFQLGWGEGDRARAEWASANPEQRRKMLDALPSGPIDVDAKAVTDPVWQDELDWFATSTDLRNAHLKLQELAKTEAGAPVRDILAKNPGQGMKIGDEWTYVAFKGGSSVGELAGSWYVERADGEAFTLSIQAASEDPADVADAQAYFGQIEDALALLADQ